MKVKDFIALYEEHKPHVEKLPDITSKKIKSFSITVVEDVLFLVVNLFCIVNFVKNCFLS